MLNASSTLAYELFMIEVSTHERREFKQDVRCEVLLADAKVSKLALRIAARHDGDGVNQFERRVLKLSKDTIRPAKLMWYFLEKMRHRGH